MPDSERDARMTLAEEREIRAAFERDKWAGEWNSLPTAINRLLAGRVADIKAEAVSGIRGWAAINEIAGPPLDWDGLVEFLTRVLPPGGGRA